MSARFSIRGACRVALLLSLLLLHCLAASAQQPAASSTPSDAASSTPTHTASSTSIPEASSTPTHAASNASIPEASSTPTPSPAAPADSPSTAPAGAASPAAAGTPASRTPAAPLAAPSGGVLVVPVPLSIVIEKAAAARATSDKIVSVMADDSELTTVEAQMRDLKSELLQFGLRVDKTLSADPTLDSLQALSSDLHALADPLETWTQLLTTRSNTLEADHKTLQGLESTWQLTQRAAADSNAPQQIRDDVASVCARIAAADMQVAARMQYILLQQAQLGEIRATADDLQQRLAVASTRAAHQILQRDNPPLWTAQAYTGIAGMPQVEAAVARRIEMFSKYLEGRPRSPMVHACIVLALFVIVLAARHSFRKWDAAAGVPTPGLVTGTPLATAWVMSMLSLVYLYPAPPRVFGMLLTVINMLAGAVVIRPQTAPRLRVVLLVLPFLGLLDITRGLVVSEVTIFRMILAIEQLAGIGFIIWFLRSGRLAETAESEPRAVRAMRIATGYGLVGLSGAFVANAAGYTSLSRMMSNLTLGPIYAAIIIAATLGIIDTFLLFGMRVRPLAGLGAIRRHRDRLRNILRYILLFAGLGLWLQYVVSQTPMQAILIAQGRAFMNLDLGLWGATPLGITMFVVAVACSFVLSRIVLVLLEEDVYTRVALPNGLPHAISTMMHYILVLLGFLVALSALGLDMTRFTVMVSAFGVGLGFGLQTIVNNVVSGIILLFERPVKIGDVIEMSNNRGTLTHIGLRASVLHAADGSDIILPNGTLLSNNLVNYTFEDQHRRIEIEVQVPIGNDAEALMAKLVEQAEKVEHVLAEPEPECHFVKFTDKALILEVRAWVDSTVHWTQVRTQLNLAIYGTLLRDGLVTALPPPKS